MIVENINNFIEQVKDKKPRPKYIVLHPKIESMLNITFDKQGFKKYKGLKVHSHFLCPLDKVYFYNYKKDIKI